MEDNFNLVAKSLINDPRALERTGLSPENFTFVEKRIEDAIPADLKVNSAASALQLSKNVPSLIFPGRSVCLQF